MEVLFDFIFELFKISIQSSVYATLTLLVFMLIGHYKQDSWFARVTINKKRLWFVNGFLISITLFCFMFTYWGIHGLGDFARIPIGHGKDVRQINGSGAYLPNTNNRRSEMNIGYFAITNNYICGEPDG